MSEVEAALLSAFKLIEPIANPGMINYFNAHYNRFVETLELLIKHVQPGQKVLDVGFFPGYLTIAARYLGFEVYGVDIEPSELVRIAHERSVKVFKCNIENERLPFDDRNFDCVVFTEMLEHINPWSIDYVVSEMHRVLKNKGYLLISTPNLTTLENRLFFLFGKGVIRWGHSREYTLKETIDLLSFGFEIAYSNYSMCRDILTIKHVNGMDKAVREHVLKGFIKHRHWKNIGRALVYPLKKLHPPLRSTIFIVARKNELTKSKKNARSLAHYRGFGD